MKRILFVIWTIVLCVGWLMVGCSTDETDNIRVIRDAELAVDAEPPAELASALALVPVGAKSVSVSLVDIFVLGDEGNGGTIDGSGFEDAIAMLGVNIDAIDSIVGVRLEEIDEPTLLLQGNIDSESVVETLSQSSVPTGAYAGVPTFRIEGPVWPIREDIGAVFEDGVDVAVMDRGIVLASPQAITQIVDTVGGGGPSLVDDPDFSDLIALLPPAPVYELFRTSMTTFGVYESVTSTGACVQYGDESMVQTWVIKFSDASHAQSVLDDLKDKVAQYCEVFSPAPAITLTQGGPFVIVVATIVEGHQG